MRFSTNFLTLILSETFIELQMVSMEHMQRVWYATRERLPYNKYGSVSLLRLAIANAQIIETSFP